MIHANGVLIGEFGVLIRGASGAGKSTLCRQLIATAHQRGRFASLVSDDRLEISYAGGRAIMRPHPAIAGQMERRWQGITDTAFEPAAVICAVVELTGRDSAADPPPRLPDPDSLYATFGQIAIPCLRLPGGLDIAVQAEEIFYFVETKSSAIGQASSDTPEFE